MRFKYCKKWRSSGLLRRCSLCVITRNKRTFSYSSSSLDNPSFCLNSSFTSSVWKWTRYFHLSYPKQHQSLSDWLTPTGNWCPKHSRRMLITEAVYVVSEVTLPNYVWILATKYRECYINFEFIMFENNICTINLENLDRLLMEIQRNYDVACEITFEKKISKAMCHLKHHHYKALKNALNW